MLAFCCSFLPGGRTARRPATSPPASRSRRLSVSSAAPTGSKQFTAAATASASFDVGCVLIASRGEKDHLVWLLCSEYSDEGGFTFRGKLRLLEKCPHQFPGISKSGRKPCEALSVA